MEFNLTDNIEYCFVLVRDSYPLNLIYYSHLISVISALLVGFFVFLNNKSALVNKILLALSLVFSAWVSINLVIWISANSKMIMLLWSLSGILIGLLFILSLYFSYVFMYKKDASVLKKVLVGALFLPIVALTPSKLNLLYFSIANDCEVAEGPYFTNYYYALSLLIFVWILVMAIIKYRNSEKDFKRQILLFSAGIELFLLSFFTALFISSLTGIYEIEFYGIASMAVFMGLISYMIVKYRAFEIKLLGAQALVIALMILIGSEFFFAESLTNKILIGITLAIATIFGWFLIRSVKEEVQRKEELQMMSDKLAQANDQLRKLDNSKSEFISIASHQLRTPITAIKGFVSLLLEGSYGKIAPKQEDALNKVYSSNERLLTLVEDLLNVSRIESGRMEFKLRPTSVVEICQEVTDTLSMKARERKLYLNWDKPEESIAELVIDGTKVREVISNMVDNALKYTEKGGVTVRVQQGQFPVTGEGSDVNATREAVRVIVSDTGIGIPQEELPYLFSKFSRGKDIARLNTGGTGLGLYVGRAMIEQNGGRIWAESDGAGLGSRFIIELPVVQSEELMKRWGNVS